MEILAIFRDRSSLVKLHTRTERIVAAKHTMSETSNKNPEWQSAEIEFLLHHGIISDPDHLREFSCVKSRWVYSTLREVLLTPSGHVLKRFTHLPGRRDHRRVWLREHRALQKLGGHHAPRSLGFVTAANPAKKSSTVLYVREMLPGSPIPVMSETTVEKIAELLADFHQRGVVTLDPQPENFIVPEGDPEQLGFIDFGRARCFRSGGLLMLLHIGKEIHRLRIEAGLNQRLFDHFLEAYFSVAKLTPIKHRIVIGSYRYWRKRHGRKYGGQ